MPNEPVKVGMVSLGCNKNRVDAELMLGRLAGYEITGEPAEADVIIVNTCGFIDSAKEESIETILEMAGYKKTGRLRGLVVTGCLSERYREELEAELPEVDVFLGVTAHGSIREAVEKAAAGGRMSRYDAPTVEGEYKYRFLTTPPHMAYLKIAEGCDNRCAYCSIPMIRGAMQSRPQEDVLEEAKHLVSLGVKEIVVVAQDTTRYGADIYGAPRLAELLGRLAEESGAKWIRPLYCYPESITEALIETMARHENIGKYIDMPVQHLDDGVLRRMGRRNTYASTRDAVQRISQADSRFVIRTTLIAGFPGETEEEFANLCQRMQELRFDRLGVFAYSQEEGTRAAKMQGQLPLEERQRRADALMALQRDISQQAGQRRVGEICEAVVEDLAEKGVYAARSYAEAPEIDGTIFVESTDVQYEIGDFLQVKLISASDYDWIGVPVR